MKKKVLIVDDSLFMRSIIKKIVEKNGLEVIAEAQNGVEAIDKYKKYNPDYTFLDIIMEKMNGVEVLKEIVSYNPKATIIMCSSMGQQNYVIECIKHGAKDFIVKPFDESRFQFLLENLSEI